MSQESNAIDNLVDPLEIRVRELLPENWLVSSYYPLGKALEQLPAAYIELPEMGAVKNLGSGQLEIEVEVEIRLMTGSGKKAAKDARRAATILIPALHDSFMVPGMQGPMKFMRMVDDNFDFIVTGYESLVMTFFACILLGQEVWRSESVYEGEGQQYPPEYRIKV